MGGLLGPCRLGIPITNSGRGGLSGSFVTGILGVFTGGVIGDLFTRGGNSGGLLELASLEKIESTKFISCLAPCGVLNLKVLLFLVLPEKGRGLNLGMLAS